MAGRAKVGAIAWCVAAALVPLAAQAPQQTTGRADAAQAPLPTFRSSVELVALNVTVTNPRQEPVEGLRADDFVVIEDGVQQSVTFFAADALPLDLALLVDGSASMADKIQLVREAAAGFLGALREGDRSSLIEFRDHVRTRASFTEDLASVAGALDGIVPRGGTALYNALYIALKELDALDGDAGTIRRRAIVVLSDGDDTASLLGFDDVLELARRTGVSIYAIALKSPDTIARQRAMTGRRFHTPADFAMRTLAQETGGRAFFPARAEELKFLYGRIADELARQYSIGYTPLNRGRGGEFRRVVVRLPSHPGARPHTRAGYFAEELKRFQLAGGPG